MNKQELKYFIRSIIKESADGNLKKSNLDYLDIASEIIKNNSYSTDNIEYYLRKMVSSKSQNKSDANSNRDNKFLGHISFNELTPKYIMNSNEVTFEELFRFPSEFYDVNSLRNIRKGLKIYSDAVKEMKPLFQTINFLIMRL